MQYQSCGCTSARYVTVCRVGQSALFVKPTIASFEPAPCTTLVTDFNQIRPSYSPRRAAPTRPAGFVSDDETIALRSRELVLEWQYPFYFVKQPHVNSGSQWNCQQMQAYIIYAALYTVLNLCTNLFSSLIGFNLVDAHIETNTVEPV